MYVLWITVNVIYLNFYFLLSDRGQMSAGINGGTCGVQVYLFSPPALPFGRLRIN
jgi:hypothetical protein